jgi:hypothetical protein
MTISTMPSTEVTVVGTGGRLRSTDRAGATPSLRPVKRTVLLIGVPLVLVVLWLADHAGAEHSAKVDIVADHPTDFRRTVIATVTGLGGRRVGESTSFGGRGSSRLTFEVPTAHLDDALDALGRLGGRVTDQQVDLTDASAKATSMSDQLAEVRSCLAGVGTSGDVSGRLDECRTTLDRATGQLDASKVDLTTSTLDVEVEAAGVSNPALVIAIVLLIAGAIGAAILVWRMSRDTGVAALDLRDFDGYESDDDLHLRRN